MSFITITTLYPIKLKDGSQGFAGNLGIGGRVMILPSKSKEGVYNLTITEKEQQAGENRGYKTQSQPQRPRPQQRESQPQRPAPRAPAPSRPQPQNYAKPQQEQYAPTWDDQDPGPSFDDIPF